jgi:ABC-type polysaccharide/polyol phosphate export permease
MGVVIFLVMAVVAAIPLHVGFLLVAPAVVLALLLTGALGLVLSALHVYFRDMRYLVSAALLIWFYATPVFYPLDAVPQLRPWLQLNPMTGAIELFRAGTIGADHGWLTSVGISVAWVAGLTAVAALLHRRFNRIFADLL